MSVVDDIRKHGFRRWYERQLIESHAYLLTAFLALILMLAGMEALGYLRGSPLYYLAVIGVAAGAGTLTLIAWRRFNTLLMRALTFSASATCVQCQAWGKFEVLQAEAAPDDEPVEAGRPHWLRVRCRACGHDWRLG